MIEMEQLLIDHQNLLDDRISQESEWIINIHRFHLGLEQGDLIKVIRFQSTTFYYYYKDQFFRVNNQFHHNFQSNSCF